MKFAPNPILTRSEGPSGATNYTTNETIPNYVNSKESRYCCLEGQGRSGDGKQNNLLGWPWKKSWTAGHLVI